jgi:signal peptidase I
MKSIAICLLAGAGALLAGSANASDVYTSGEYANSDLVQQVRMVCDDSGRCYRSRGGDRVVIRDSYNYAPRERYIEQRRYRDYDEPRAGVGIRAPGVSVGIGVDNDRW